MRKLPKEKNYEPPIVEIIEVKVEEGFAASNQDPIFRNPGMDWAE